MPAFILISGFFREKWTKTLDDFSKKIVASLHFLSVVVLGYYTLIGLQDSFSLDLGIPQWSLWFLLSLFCWNVLLHLTHKFSVRQVLIASILIALLVGYFPIFDRFLAVQRTLTFFPYFMLGYVIPKNWVEKLKTYPKKWMALLLFSGLFLFIQGNDLINKYWVFGSKPYEDYLNQPLLGGPQRLIFFIAGLIGIVAFLMIVPKNGTFSPIGEKIR